MQEKQLGRSLVGSLLGGLGALDFHLGIDLIGSTFLEKGIVRPVPTTQVSHSSQEGSHGASCIPRKGEEGMGQRGEFLPTEVEGVLFVCLCVVSSHLILSSGAIVYNVYS